MKNLLFLLYIVAFITMIMLSTPTKSTENLADDLTKRKDSISELSSNKTKTVSNTIQVKFN